MTVDEVSLALLVKYLPDLVAQGIDDPLGYLVERRAYGGFIRPSRRMTYKVPEDLEIIPPPPDLVSEREPCDAERRCSPNRINRPPS